MASNLRLSFMLGPQCDQQHTGNCKASPVCHSEPEPPSLPLPKMAWLWAVHPFPMAPGTGSTGKSLLSPIRNIVSYWKGSIQPEGISAAAGWGGGVPGEWAKMWGAGVEGETEQGEQCQQPRDKRSVIWLGLRRGGLTWQPLTRVSTCGWLFPTLTSVSPVWGCGRGSPFVAKVIHPCPPARDGGCSWLLQKPMLGNTQPPRWRTVLHVSVPSFQAEEGTGCSCSQLEHW